MVHTLHNLRGLSRATRAIRHDISSSVHPDVHPHRSVKITAYQMVNAGPRSRFRQGGRGHHLKANGAPYCLPGNRRSSETRPEPRDFWAHRDIPHTPAHRHLACQAIRTTSDRVIRADLRNINPRHLATAEASLCLEQIRNIISRSTEHFGCRQGVELGKPPRLFNRSLNHRYRSSCGRHFTRREAKPTAHCP
jgi:hypothetical protein